MSLSTIQPPAATNSASEDRDSGVWDYISPSRLNFWLRCPLAFKLRYIEGLRTPTTPSLFLGKVVHAGLETYYRHRQVGVCLASDDVVQNMTARWALLVDEEQMPFENAAEEVATREKAAELVRAYLQQVDPDEPVPLAVETTLQVPLVDPQSCEDLGVPLLGVVDLVLDSENRSRGRDSRAAR